MGEEYLAGSCGKLLRDLCYPDFEDDLCASCVLNGNSVEHDETEGSE